MIKVNSELKLMMMISDGMDTFGNQGNLRIP
jgi:hypothetical protein